MKIHGDFETYSELDVRQVGSYRYASHPSTEVLIFCWSYDDEERIYTWTPGMEVPEHLTEKIEAGWTFEAHNSSFERSIWEYQMVKKHGCPRTKRRQWSCTAIRAAAAGLPRALDKALAAMGSKERKDPEGSRLISIFSKPRKVPRKQEWKRTLPSDKPEEFKKFKAYCRQDVRSERWLSAHIPELHKRWKDLMVLDMKMNDRGLPIDLDSVHKASAIIHELGARINARIRKLSGGVNATQRDKFLAVLQEHGADLENLKAQELKDFLKDEENLSPKVRELIELRLEAGKASTKKLASMIKCAMEDGRIRGAFLMNGAHTGRYAGRYVQPQNFIRGKLTEVQQAIVFQLLQREDPELFEMLYDWPIDAISQCMRGFIQAPDGYRFVVVDYKAIEARILAWTANDKQMLKDYRAGLDLYRLLAADLFNVAVEDVSSEQRRIAKNLILGCGYGLGGANFVGYCAKEGLHISESFAKKAVKKYRARAAAIVQSWSDTEEAAVNAVENPGRSYHACKVTYKMEGRWLTCELPSGRKLYYRDPKVENVTKFDKPAKQLSFRSEFKGKWIRERTWGGTLVENYVQAMACDVMVEGMFAAEEHDYPVVGTVHDELVTLVKKGFGSQKDLCAIACIGKPWMKGIPLEAEGFECLRYRKG